MNNSAQTTVSTDELVGALDARGVPFLTGGIQSPQALALTPAELVQGLVLDEDARVQLALIPLMLVHPEYADVIPELADKPVLEQHKVAGSRPSRFLETSKVLRDDTTQSQVRVREGKTRETLMLYYTAAYWLQCKFKTELDHFLGESSSLPDLFGKPLEISETDPDAALTALGEIHRALDNEPINWRGTYEHAARRLLKHMKAQETWAI